MRWPPLRCCRPSSRSPFPHDWQTDSPWVVDSSGRHSEDWLIKGLPHGTADIALSEISANRWSVLPTGVCETFRQLKSPWRDSAKRLGARRPPACWMALTEQFDFFSITAATAALRRNLAGGYRVVA